MSSYKTQILAKNTNVSQQKLHLTKHFNRKWHRPKVKVFNPKQTVTQRKVTKVSIKSDGSQNALYHPVLG